jgi:hypothetical protein
MSPRLALSLLLILAACATPPPPQASRPAPPLARAALAEWQAWGGVVREGWPDDRPADTAATPQRFARLVGYWEAAGGAGVAAQLRRQRANLETTLSEQGSSEFAASGPAGPEDIAIYAYPFWSAAFISAVAREAGVPERDLPSSFTHARYVDAALARAAADPAGAAFRPEDPASYAPKPGDLLCADRTKGIAYTHWTDRLAHRGQSRPMHCDVVVRSAPGVVEAIGGNVDEMVVLRRLPADRQGRVLQAPGDKSQFFLVLAAR